jgi:hypothetical protein
MIASAVASLMLYVLPTAMRLTREHGGCSARVHRAHSLPDCDHSTAAAKSFLRPGLRWPCCCSASAAALCQQTRCTRGSKRGSSSKCDERVLGTAKIAGLPVSYLMSSSCRSWASARSAHDRAEIGDGEVELKHISHHEPCVVRHQLQLCGLGLGPRG